MRGLPVPDRTEDFTADPVELFFDLAYVFAFSQIVGRLLEDHTWGGVARTALLFFLVWLPWTTFSWSTNAVPGNNRSVRALVLVATVASVPMAASVTTALGAGGTVFAVSASVIVFMGLSMGLVAHETGSGEFRSTVVYAVPNLIAIAVLIAGSFVGGDGRLWLWTAAAAIVIWGTIQAGSGQWVVRGGHFAERHGLIVIVALGEIIVALGIPVVANLESGAGIPKATLAALLAAGLFASLLWWGYFDRAGPAFEFRIKQLPDADKGRFARDVYTYAHAPIVAGLILAATALEEVALHPEDPVPTAFEVMLVAGLALFLGGIAIGVYRSFRMVARERLVALVVIAIVVATTTELDGLVVLVLVDVLLFLMLVAEQLRVEASADEADEPVG